ncbi:MAG: hypothetical protein ABSD38_34240 [Syntrophorhabdales bacterium]|jgi:hypothetical protein
MKKSDNKEKKGSALTELSGCVTDRPSLLKLRAVLLTPPGRKERLLSFRPRGCIAILSLLSTCSVSK